MQDQIDHKFALVPGRYVGFDKKELSSAALLKLKDNFVELRAALEQLPSEIANSVNVFEEFFHG
jgi:type I restriction enzyme M protein